MLTLCSLVTALELFAYGVGLEGVAGTERAQQNTAPASGPGIQRASSEQQVSALRVRARARSDQDRDRYTTTELADIEYRYRSAHTEEFPMFLRWPAGEPVLLDLIATYPQSNRAGCALVELARRANGQARERFLKQAIASHGDAWFENGVQVGAIARALLATHYAGQDRWDEAERLARELSDDYAGSIDESGWPLDDVLTGVRLLRSKK